MKKETLIKKLEGHFDKLHQELDEISILLEIEMEDDELSEMCVCFRGQVEACITENEECNYNNIIEYIRENL